MNIEKFTDAQRAVIETTAQNVVVLAGPGSGKTATVVARINQLIDDGTEPRKIAAITFTNAAARELEERIYGERMPSVVAGAFPSTREQKLGHVGTLHSFCLRMLREHAEASGYGSRLSVISPESAVDLIVSKAKTLGCKLPLKDLLALKAKGRPEIGGKLSVAETVVASYFDDLREAGVVDLDVLLTEFLRVLKTDLAVQTEIAVRFDHLFVDEVQDSSETDWNIYRALPIAHKCHVGDPDQAIYSFRGGDVQCMREEIRDEWTKLFFLEENFRSRSEICDAANALIGHNPTRYDKETRSVRGHGGAVLLIEPQINEGAEIGRVAGEIKLRIELGEDPCEIAVLARTNAIAHGFAKTIAACGLPVVAKEKSDLPLDWPFVRSLVELLANPDNDTLAFFFLVALYRKLGADEKEARSMAHAVAKTAASIPRTINEANLHFSRGLNAVGVVGIVAEKGASLESRFVLAKIVDEIGPNATALEFALNVAGIRHREKDAAKSEGIEVTTIHVAKGREWDTVFVVGCEDETFPGKRNDEEEERRLLYVAITRARKRLYFSSAASRVTTWGAIVPRTPSRFLAEIGGAS